MFRFFTITDYEAEGKWLRSMHASAVQFIWAALPYVAMGTGAALLAGSARKKGGR
ncbi:MAG: hypothetical protein PUE04_08125 [Lachnospira sp.]|nr:hypothetical protein [Lachnospira sp.]